MEILSGHEIKLLELKNINLDEIDDFANYEYKELGKDMYEIRKVEDDKWNTFELAKKSKIEELSIYCEQLCLNGIDFAWNEGTEEEPKIETYHYSLKEVDQSKISLLYSKVLEGQLWTSWHYDGGKCEKWSAEKFRAFAEQSILFVTSNTVRFNTGLRPYIQSLTEDNSSIAEIIDIGWDFSLPQEIEMDIQNMISLTMTGNEIQ